MARDDVLDVDVCIVGAGVAGITLARELEGTGLRVLVLESGGHDGPGDPDDLRHVSVGYSYYRAGHARDRGVGGSSLHWPLDEGWRARPLDPIDFERRPGIAHSGWPLSRRDLDPYYERANAVCELGPAEYDVESWEQPFTPQLPLDPAVAHTTMFQLGSTNFGRFSDELAGARDVRILLHATVTALEQGPDLHRIDRVHVAAGEGIRFSVRADAFVLAMGGIDNPRLLLASTGRQPGGVGNGRDLVGRFFMERLSTRSAHIVPDDPELVARATLYGVHRVRGTRVEATVRLTDDVIRREQLLNCTCFLLVRSEAFTAEAVRSVATLVKGTRRWPPPDGVARHVRNIVVGGRDLSRLVRQRMAPPTVREHLVLAVRPQGEQLPNPESRVTLDERTDRFDVPRARLDWRLSELDRRSIRRTQQLLGTELERAGVGRLIGPLGDEDPPALFEGNRHHMGTTRMDDDPARGVVDRDGRMHEVRNLYVTGSSVFPTAGCSNPTLTIAALALRLGDHLRAALGVDRRRSGAADVATARTVN